MKWSGYVEHDTTIEQLALLFYAWLEYCTLLNLGAVEVCAEPMLPAIIFIITLIIIVTIIIITIIVTVNTIIVIIIIFIVQSCPNAFFLDLPPPLVHKQSYHSEKKYVSTYRIVTGGPWVSFTDEPW